VDNETLFKFLTNPLKSEIQDTHDKRQRKLMEPQSVQTWFDLTNEASGEKRFNETMEYLEEWDKDYTRSGRRIDSIKGVLDMQKQKACFSKIEELVDKMYGNIRNTRLRFYRPTEKRKTKRKPDPLVIPKSCGGAQ
jgi:hypothetical protein